MAFVNISRVSELFALLFVVCACGPWKVLASDVRVIIPGQGMVIGNKNTTIWTGQSYMQFRGIPYAESPSGELRFRPAVPRNPWSQPLQATEYGRICPQLFTFNRLPADKLKGDLEDCLTLNIFTKKLNAKQPVMFYIHGGSLQVGFASDYPPGYLLEEDIVLVVIQYRLGVLGFSSTRTRDMPGNLGLTDTMLALQWVQQHIAAFGGDPSLVTVFGESSGGELGGALLISSKTPSLSFQRLIIQSGSVVDKWAVNNEPLEQVKRICEALKCGQCELVDEMNRCLKQAAVVDLLKAAEMERYGLIIDDPNGIIAQHPAKLIENLKCSVPLMSGFTKHDGSLVLGWFYDEFKASHKNMSAVTVGQFASGLMDWMNDTTGLTNNVLTRLLFPADLWHGYDHKRAIPAYFDLANILFFKSTMIGFTNKLISHSYHSPIYFYTFDYAGQHTHFGFDLGNAQYPFNGGVHHTDELMYLFPTNHLNSADSVMAKRMVELWISFASAAVPKLVQGPEILPMKSIRGPYFHINRKVTIADDLLLEFTATIDDHDNKNLERPNKEF